MQYGIVRLTDLSNDENIFISISEELENKILKNVKQYFTDKNELVRTINQKHIRLKTFMKMMNFLHIKNYESGVVWIGGKTRRKGIKNPVIPFNFNNEYGGKFIGAVLGDGTFPYNFEIQYRNYSALLLKNIKKTAKKIFGRVEIVHEDVTSVTFPRIIGKIIKLLGMNQGRKTLTNPHIPQFVINGSKECKIGFLKQISDDEGSPLIRPPNSYSIRFEFAIDIPSDKFHEREQYVPHLLKELCQLFRDMGYSTTNIYGGRIYKGRKKPRYGVSWAFDIQGKESLEKFAHEINFRDIKKGGKIENGLKHMKILTYGRKSQRITLSHFYNIQRENAKVTKHDLAVSIKRSLRNAEEWLRKFKERCLVEKIGGDEFIGGGFKGLHGRTPAEYKMTEKGLSFLKYLETQKDILQVNCCPKHKDSLPYSPWKD